MNYTQNWNSQFVKNVSFLPRHSLDKVLECGVFEGLTSNYIVDNLLAPEGCLLCIDPLSNEYSLDDDNSLFRGQFERFIENTEHNRGKIDLCRDQSYLVFPVLPSNSFDFIYIDGHHTEAAVYQDGIDAMRVCKVGGYILFDDYLWGNDYSMKKGIDRFLSEYKNHRLLLKYNQVLIQKLEEGSETQDGQDWYQGECIKVLFSWDKIYSSYCNLDSRPDRNEKMIAEIEKSGIPMVRTRSFPWKELYDSYDEAEKKRVDGMIRRKTPGALGCHFSQVAIMEEALRQGKHAFVNEDDVRFCEDIQERLKIIFKFLNQHEWDIFWFGGTYHKEPTWHKSVEGKHTHPEMQMCNCNLNRDWEETLNPYIVRTFGAFSTHSYLVNKDRLKHILERLDFNVYRSMGIDFIMLLEQPNLNTFAFNTGCCKQFDNRSDIGDGISKFSGFANLGRHWFSETMDKF